MKQKLWWLVGLAAIFPVSPFVLLGIGLFTGLAPKPEPKTEPVAPMFTVGDCIESTYPNLERWQEQLQLQIVAVGERAYLVAPAKIDFTRRLEDGWTLRFLEADQFKLIECPGPRLPRWGRKG